MKKAIAVLLSLILVLCFVSCDGSVKAPEESNGGSTNTPSDNSTDKPSIDIPTAPIDSNVPDSSKFVDLGGEDVPGILSVFEAFFSNEKRTISVKQRWVENYVIKEGTAITYYDPSISDYAERKFSGSYSVLNDNSDDGSVSVNKDIYNGTVKINDAEYVFSNFTITYTRSDAEYGDTFSGSITKNGEAVDVTDITSDSDSNLSSFLNDFNESEYCTMSLSDAEGGVYYSVNDNPLFVGSFSQSISSTKDTAITDIIVNFEKAKLSDGKTHSLTAKFKVTGSLDGEDKSFSVEYLSFDGKYFTPASVKANEDVMSALAKLLG